MGYDGWYGCGMGYDRWYGCATSTCGMGWHVYDSVSVDDAQRRPNGLVCHIQEPVEFGHAGLGIKRTIRDEFDWIRLENAPDVSERREI